MKRSSKIFNTKNNSCGSMLVELLLSIALAAVVIPFIFQYQQKSVERAENILIQNDYITKIIDFHKNNIIIEATRYNNLKKPETKKSKGKSKPNKFVRQVTKDIFTGETVYVYTNLKTGETIKSTDGNKLDELNAKKKAKKEKTSYVPMSAMTFKF